MAGPLCQYHYLRVSMILFTLNLQTPKTSLRKGLLAADWLETLLLVGSVLMFLLGLGSGGVSQP